MVFFELYFKLYFLSFLLDASNKVVVALLESDFYWEKLLRKIVKSLTYSIVANEHCHLSRVKLLLLAIKIWVGDSSDWWYVGKD